MSAKKTLAAYYRLYPEAKKYKPELSNSKRKLFRCSHCQKETPLLLGIADELAYHLSHLLEEAG